MKRIILTVLVGITLSTSSAFAQKEPLAEQIKSKIQHEAFTVNALVQAGFRYSLANDEFQGGRTFEAANARLSFRGMLDGKFYYRVFFNMVSEPNLLDAFIGYQHSDALRITAGAMKPKQTQDYIPDPGSTDFIDRTKITGLLVQSREIGISAEGDVNGLYYYSGLFNGNKMSSNNNNKFYGIGRLQYTFKNIIPGTLQLAVQGSYGDSPNVRSGSVGPMLRGERTIYGCDMRLETDHFLLAAEYLAGQLEIADIADKKEEISGYYVTAGYKLFKETMFLGRWQSWGYIDFSINDYSEKGFGLFWEVYKFPLYLIGASIPIIGMFIAYLRYCQYDKQLKINQQAFEADYRPFALFSSFQYNRSDKKFEFEITNIGRHPARVISIHFDYREPTKNRMATFQRDYFVILKDKIKVGYIELKHDKPQIVESWFDNKEPTEIHITMHYMGLYDFNFYTIENWRLNTSKEIFELKSSEWK